MAELNPQRIGASIKSLLQVPGGVTSALTTVEDGDGNATALQISKAGVKVLGDIEVTGSVVGQNTFDDLPPEPVAATATAGDSLSASRSDHVHAHGDQGGGSLHAVASGSTAGFMSAGDKTKLDALPTNDTLTTALAGKIATNGDASQAVVKGRTLDARAGDVVHVKDAPFNAVFDGSTDDTAAIQAAIDFAAGRGGGDVALPAGTAIVTGLTLRSTVTLTGQGRHATQIKLKAGSAGPVIAGALDQFGSGSYAGIYSWGLRNLTVSGNKASCPSGIGMKVYGYSFRLDNICVEDCGSLGVWTEWGQYGAGAQDSSMEARVTNVVVDRCDGGGLLWNGPHDSTFVNVHVPMSKGVGIEIGPRGNGCQFVNTHVYSGQSDNSQITYAWKIGGNAVQLANCTGEGAPIAQALVLANNFIVSGGAWYAGYGEPNSAKGFIIGNAGTQVIGYDIRTIGIYLDGGMADFANDGGGRIDVEAFNLNVGAVGYVGAPSSGSTVRIFARGLGSSQRIHREPIAQNFLDRIAIGGTHAAEYAVHAKSSTGVNGSLLGEVQSNSENAEVRLRRSLAGGAAVTGAGTTVAAFVGEVYNGTTQRAVGSLAFETDGAITGDEAPGRLRVYLTADGGATPALALQINNSKQVTVQGPLQLKSYTVATVPSAVSVGPGAEIYVSNESGGAVTAYSDGANWRRCTDRAVIS